MSNRFSRSATALSLALSIWLSAVAAVAAPLQEKSQPQNQKATAQQQAAVDKKADVKAPAVAAAPTFTVSGRVLVVQDTKVGQLGLKAFFQPFAAGFERVAHRGVQPRRARRGQHDACGLRGWDDFLLLRLCEEQEVGREFHSKWVPGGSCGHHLSLLLGKPGGSHRSWWSSRHPGGHRR